MNSKVKGVLQVLLVLVLIAAFAFVAARGIGGAHRGSAKNIRLGFGRWRECHISGLQD